MLERHSRGRTIQDRLRELCETLAMARLLAVAIALTALLAAAEARPRPARAQRFSANKGFGLGVMVGAPTGLTGKYFLGRDTALDFGVGVVGRYRYHDALHAHGDLLWHPAVLASIPAFMLPLYFGVGVRLLQHDRFRDDYDSHTHIGVRAPIGLAMDFNRVPLDVFFELALVFDVLTDDAHGYVDLNAAIGVRYYFN